MQEALKSGKPKGSFKRWDKHPFVENLYYYNWNNNKGYERWYTKEAIEKTESNKRAKDKTPEGKAKKRAGDKRYREENLEKVLANQRKHLQQIQHIYDWRKSDQGIAFKKAKKRREQNRRSQEYLSDPSNRLAHAFRCSLRQVLVGRDKTGSSLEYLGCSIEDFRERIESLWEKGMNWENFGRNGWHIDHITPCSWFDLTDDKQAKECFNYKNLQPMWESDNCSKKDRWVG